MFFIPRMSDAIFPRLYFARRNSNEVAPMRSGRQVTFVATKVQLAWQILQPYQYTKTYSSVDFTYIKMVQHSVSYNLHGQYSSNCEYGSHATKYSELVIRNIESTNISRNISTINPQTNNTFPYCHAAV